MLHLIAHYLLTPLLTIKHAVTNTIRMFIPTQMYYVAHINTDNNVTTLIHPERSWAFDRTAIMHLSKKERESGYYYIRTWDGLARTTREYFLSAANLQSALGLSSIANWWAMHDYGIQVLLNCYMAYHKNEIDSGYLFAIYDNTGEDLSHHVHYKLLRSLELKGNVTAKALTLLLHHLGHLPDDHHVTKVVDFDLNERLLGPDDYLLPKN